MSIESKTITVPAKLEGLDDPEAEFWRQTFVRWHLRLPSMICDLLPPRLADRTIPPRRVDRAESYGGAPVGDFFSGWQDMRDEWITVAEHHVSRLHLLLRELRDAAFMSVVWTLRTNEMLHHGAEGSDPVIAARSPVVWMFDDAIARLDRIIEEGSL